MEDVILEALRQTEEKISEMSEAARSDYFACLKSLERQAVAIAAISVISKHKLPAENFPYGCLCDVANGHHCGDTGISANFTVTLQGKQ